MLLCIIKDSRFVPRNSYVPETSGMSCAPNWEVFFILFQSHKLFDFSTTKHFRAGMVLSSLSTCSRQVTLFPSGEYSYQTIDYHILPFIFVLFITNCSIITLTSYKVHRQMSKVGVQIFKYVTQIILCTDLSMFLFMPLSS